MENIPGLYKKVKKGSKSAFEQLFTLLYPSMCSYAFTFIKNTEDAEEIVQDIFFRFWMKRENIEITTDVKSYLFKAVKNKCLVFIQHQKVKLQYAKYISEVWENESFDVEEYIDTFELENIIGKTLEGFSERMKGIFILSRFEGLKYHEIAGKMSVSVKTVEANISKALKIFRKTLGDYVKIQS